MIEYACIDAQDNQLPQPKIRLKQLKAAIRDLENRLQTFDYDYKYGECSGGDVSMTVKFNPAESVNIIVNRAINKSQLLLDVSGELQELSLIMQRRAVLDTALGQIPYKDLSLHKEKVSDIKAQIKTLDLQILEKVAVIKQAAISQQDTLLTGYTDGIL